MRSFIRSNTAIALSFFFLFTLLLSFVSFLPADSTTSIRPATSTALSTFHATMQVSDTLSAASTKAGADAQDLTSLTALTANTSYIFYPRPWQNGGSFYFCGTTDNAVDTYVIWAGKLDDSSGFIHAFELATISLTTGTKLFDATMEFADIGAVASGDEIDQISVNSSGAAGAFRLSFDLRGVYFVCFQKTVDGSDSVIIFDSW